MIDGNPNSEGFTVRDVVLPPAISQCRAENRQALRKALDQMQRYPDKLAEDPAVTFDKFYEQGIASGRLPQAQRAFDIGRESPPFGMPTDAMIWVSGCCWRGAWSRSA